MLKEKQTDGVKYENYISLNMSEVYLRVSTCSSIYTFCPMPDKECKFSCNAIFFTIWIHSKKP